MSNTLLDILLSAITPSEANAEIIPTTPGAKKVLDKALVDPSQAGEAVRLAHAQPEKVYLSDNPTVAQRWLGAPERGTFSHSPSGKANIQLNTPVLEHVSKRTGQDEAVKTLGHESGHFLGQVTRKAGDATPTRIPTLDYLFRAMSFPFGKDLRLPQGLNEAVADGIAGLEQVSPQAQALMNDILSIARGRVK